jgi:HK97 family phage major capsid protein
METRYFPATLRIGHPSADGNRANDVTEPDKKGRIPVALSSEHGVERWDWMMGERYVEVLDHSPASVDLERAALGRGLPLLLNHDSYGRNSDSFLGKVEDITVDTDRVMRGWMRFSQRADAQDVRQEVLDDLRSSVSIGYQIGDTYTSREDKKTKQVTRTYTDWVPLELSLVPVPADPMVGVGRNLDSLTPAQRAVLANRLGASAVPVVQPPTERIMPDPITPAEPVAPDVKVIREQIQAEATDRVRQYGEIAQLVPNLPADTVARWVANATSVSDAVKEAREFAAKKAAEPIKTMPGLTDKDKKRFNYARALLSQVASDPNLKGEVGRIDFGFEREMIEETARNAPHLRANTTGALLPSMLLMMSQADERERTGLDSGSATAGAEFKFTQPGDFISMLRNRMVIYRAGATIIPGLTGPLTLPRQTGAGTLTWIAENPGSDTAVSSLATDSVALAMKTAISVAKYTKQLLIAAASGNIALQQIVDGDLAEIFALGIDSAALNGGGSNQPSGILQHTGIGSVTIGADGGALTYAKIVDLETTVANANGDQGSLAYFTTPTQRGKLKKLYNVNTSYGTAPVWGGAFLDGTKIPTGILNNYPAFASNQVPSNLTKGTATTICSALIYGDAAQVLIGEWGAFDALVDPYTLAAQGCIRVVATQFLDVAIRQYQRFAAIKDAL